LGTGYALTSDAVYAAGSAGAAPPSPPLLLLLLPVLSLPSSSLLLSRFRFRLEDFLCFEERLRFDDVCLCLCLDFLSIVPKAWRAATQAGRR
jgi:hypothetical protein